MPLTLTLTSSVTLNGVAHSATGSVVIQSRGLTRQTRDLTNTYAQIGPGVSGYYIILNRGDESAYVQVVTAGGDYLKFQCTPGGHLVIPTSIDNAGATNINNIEARSATSAGTRIGIITINA